jgi:GTPase involved in cell partitioning and DNA repair
VAYLLQVREELRMYNPEYCTRPHVVVLNKMDLPVSEQGRGWEA